LPARFKTSTHELAPRLLSRTPHRWLRGMAPVPSLVGKKSMARTAFRTEDAGRRGGYEWIAA